jgi:hypothetical protein
MLAFSIAIVLISSSSLSLARSITQTTMARHRPRSKQSSKQSAANDSADKFGHGVVEECMFAL